MTYSWKWYVSTPPPRQPLVHTSFSDHYADDSYLYHEPACPCPDAGTSPRPPDFEAYLSICPRLTEPDFAAMLYFMENAASARQQLLVDRNIEGTECPWRPSNTWSDGSDVGHWRSVLQPMSQDNPWYMIEHTRRHGWQEWLQHLLGVLVPMNYVITGAIEWRDVDAPTSHGLVYVRHASVFFAQPEISWRSCDVPSGFKSPNFA